MKTLVGKLTVLPAGHKIGEGANKRGTWYRDEAGNFHAEFFKGAVGEVGQDGKYHSYSFNMSADEAEAFANMPIGTTFKVTLREKTAERTTVDENGVPHTEVVPKITASLDKQVFYHDCIMEDIEVAREGKIKRPRTTQYFADVKYVEPSKEASGDDGEG